MNLSNEPQNCLLIWDPQAQLGITCFLIGQRLDGRVVGRVGDKAIHLGQLPKGQPPKPLGLGKPSFRDQAIDSTLRDPGQPYDLRKPDQTLFGSKSLHGQPPLRFLLPAMPYP